MARSRKTRGFADVAAGIIRRADRDGKRHGARAVGAWREVAGEDISIHTCGFALRGDRELVVFVDSGAWANQLTLMSGDLVERLNTHLGEKTVTSIRFTVSRKVKDEALWEMGMADTVSFYSADGTRPVALDEIELQQAAHVAAAVTDPELRDAALKVMIKDLEQKKGARRQAALGVPKGPVDKPDHKGL